MEIFKKCKTCGETWDSRESFLNDPEIFPLGFQPHYAEAEKSFVLFHHNLAHCQTSLAVSLPDFLDMIPGFLEGESALAEEGCNGLCLTEAYHLQCEHPYCRNKLVRSFVRRLMKDKGVDPANPQIQWI